MKEPRTIKADLLTREMIRSIQPGESVLFELPSYSAVLSAKTQVYHVEKLDRISLTTTTSDNSITITRHD